MNNQEYWKHKIIQPGKLAKTNPRRIKDGIYY